MWRFNKFLKFRIIFIVWSIVFVTLAYLIRDRHENTGTFNWLTPLFADQAGYYVYLPAFFVYDFNANAFPEKIEEKTGYGFSLDSINNKVITRYTCGVAIMQAPFFLAVHAIAGFIDQPQDGFSGIYHQVANIAALFYCLIGLFFLWKFLSFYYKQSIVILTILSLFLGTNLYYYAVDSTGMSHIYSFALFAIVAWLSKMIHLGETRRLNYYFISWTVLFALIVLIRPTNILLFPFLFCLDCNSKTEFFSRVKRFLNYRVLLVLIFSFIIVFLPQFLYWKYASGNFITDSYKGYGFSNWKSPQFLKLWFAPNNGLFLYSPLYLAAIAGLFLMIKNRVKNGWIILLIFLMASYTYASWFMVSFGCGFGSRNFVEYVVLFSLPLGYLYSKISDLRKYKRYLLIFFMVALTLFNLRLVYSYSRCFQADDWDFELYRSYIIKIRKAHKSIDLKGNEQLLPENEFSKTLYLSVADVPDINFKKAVVKMRVKLERIDSEAAMVLSVNIADSTIYWNAIRLKEQISDDQLHSNQKVVGEFWLPVPLPANSTIVCYIWNLKKETLTLSKLDLYLE